MDFNDPVTVIKADYAKVSAEFNKGDFTGIINNGIMINVHLTKGRIEIFQKDSEGTFRYSGDMTLDMFNENSTRVDIYSSNIQRLQFGLGDESVKIDNVENKTKEMFVFLGIDEITDKANDEGGQPPFRGR